MAARLAEDRVTGRGTRTALGVMYGAEASAFGAAIAYATGVLWVIGAAAGGVVTVLVAFALSRVSRERRASWAVRLENAPRR